MSYDRILRMVQDTLEFKPRGPHPLAGQKAKFKPTGDELEVEDWFDRVIGTPFMLTELNRPPFILYFCRIVDKEVPPDNDVVCIKCRGLSNLVHASEIEAI
jgi:hypothetical protein